MPHIPGLSWRIIRCQNMGVPFVMADRAWHLQRGCLWPSSRNPLAPSFAGATLYPVFLREMPSGHLRGNGSSMEGMEVFVRGKSLFSQEGCLGCHKARGVGGILGPDLTRQGEKTKHEYSFQNIAGEQSVSNWIKEHFRDPEMVSPWFPDVEIHLEEEELNALATFVMGLSKPDIPFDYFTMPTLNEFKGIRDSLEGNRLCLSLFSLPW